VDDDKEDRSGIWKCQKEIDNIKKTYNGNKRKMKFFLKK